MYQDVQDPVPEGTLPADPTSSPDRVHVQSSNAQQIQKLQIKARGFGAARNLKRRVPKSNNLLKSGKLLSVGMPVWSLVNDRVALKQMIHILLLGES